MLSLSRISKYVSTRCTALLVLAAFTACTDDDAAGPGGGSEPPPPETLGFVELRFEGLKTQEPNVTALTAPTLAELQALSAERDRGRDIEDLAAADLTQPPNGNGTIQVRHRVFSSVNHGGSRYFHSTFHVRNAESNGTAYDSDRHNLTFIPIWTDHTIPQTPVSELLLSNRSHAPDSIALQVKPTGRVRLHNGNDLVPVHPDVVQFFTDAEVTGIGGTGVHSHFPYGFVVRSRNTDMNRVLPASPDTGDFAGVVDFAFRYPLQQSPSDDPDVVSVMMMAVDDSETRLSQSLEEQTPAGIDSVVMRATALNVDTVTLLPGGKASGAFGVHTLCSVRTAGSSATPAAFLVNVAGFQSFSPTPNSTITTNEAFTATFAQPVFGIGPNIFTVRGSQSGPAFRDTTYTGSGTTTITTPPGSFSPGEEVQIALTGQCPQPQVARYQVQTGGTGNFGPDTGPYSTGPGAGLPGNVVIGDLNGDGDLDLATANFGGSVSVLINNGDGTFPQNPPTFAAGQEPQSVAIGDLDGDGDLDLATANFRDDSVSVLINNGDGTFPQNNPTYAAGTSPGDIAIGDLDGDGDLDLATANDDNVSVLINNGDGTFPQNNPPLRVDNPVSVAIGDLNGDGNLDLAVVSGGHLHNISVVINNGDGTFPQNNPTYAAGMFPNSVAIGDLNGDGSLDLAVPNTDGSNVSVLINNGDGTFPQNNPPFAAGSAPGGVAIGDLNGDGSLDIAVANALDDNVSVLINDNNGQGTFPQNNPTFPVGKLPESVAIGDLDGNGSLDLAVTNANDHTVSVLPGVVP